MKTSALTISLVLVAMTISSAQDLEVCLGDNGMTGYCNSKGNVVIDQKYWDGLPFLEGHAAVLIEDKWGIINTTGFWMVEPRYEEVFNCENVLSTILVKEDGKWFFCNEYGIAITRGYEVGSPWYEFELEGSQARFTQDTWFSVIRKGKWGVVDINDEVKIPFDYEFLRVIREVVDGKEKPVSIVLKKKGRYAWQRLDAQAATGYDYEGFLGEYAELLFFKTGEKSTILNGRTGDVIEKGNRDFYTLVNQKDSVGLVNSIGQVIIPFKHQLVNLNKVEKHAVFGHYGKLGLSDLNGNVLIEPIYADINGLNTKPASVAVRNKDGQLAVYRIENEMVQQVTPFKYTSVTFNGDEINVIAGNKPGTVTLTGQESWQ